MSNIVTSTIWKWGGKAEVTFVSESSSPSEYIETGWYICPTGIVNFTGEPNDCLYNYDEPNEGPFPCCIHGGTGECYDGFNMTIEKETAVWKTLVPDQGNVYLVPKESYQEISTGLKGTGGYLTSPDIDWLELLPETITLSYDSVSTQDNTVTVSVDVDKEEIEPGNYYLIWAYTTQVDSFPYIDLPSQFFEEVENTITLNEIELFEVAIVDLPEKAVCVTPTDTGTQVRQTQELQWTDGGLGQANAATSFKLYFATTEAGLALVGDSRPATSTREFPINLVENEKYPEKTTYYWRVDSFNQWGMTTGDVWSFTTYDPDLYWDEENGEWTDYVIVAALGGGRYNQKLVVVSEEGYIYFGAV